EAADFIGGNANHDGWLAIEVDCLSDNQRIGAEVTLPEPRIQDDDGLRVCRLVPGRIQHPSEFRHGAELTKEISGYKVGRELLFFAFDRKSGGIQSEYGRECSGMFAEECHLRIGQGEGEISRSPPVESKECVRITYWHRP